MDNDFKIYQRPIAYTARVLRIFLKSVLPFIIFFSIITFANTSAKDDYNPYVILALMAVAGILLILLPETNAARFYIIEIERKGNDLYVIVLDKASIKNYHFNVQNLKVDYFSGSFTNTIGRRLIIEEPGVGWIKQYQLGYWDKQYLQELYEKLVKV